MFYGLIAEKENHCLISNIENLVAKNWECEVLFFAQYSSLATVPITF